MEFWNFLFEVEGEFPIFVAIDTDGKSFIQAKHQAKCKAREIYGVPADKIYFDGVYTDEEADEIGWDTY